MATMIRERLAALRTAAPSPATLAELGELATQAEDDPRLASLARAIETHHARSLGRHQHAVVAGAQLLEAWPLLRERGIAKDDPDDLPRRLVWGMKYVAGSAMDLPEIALSTTDEVLATLEQMLDHFGYQKPALWILQARRAYIAGDELGSYITQLTPTLTRYHHAYQCADCPGCVLTQFAEWMPDLSDVELEELLAPIMGRAPWPPDPGEWSRILDVLYGRAAACSNAQAVAPVLLARAYVRAGRVVEALRESERGLLLAKRDDPDVRVAALVARACVAEAMQSDDAIARAREVAAEAERLEDPYEALDAVRVAHRILGDEALAQRSLALAERLDARIEKKRHVAWVRAEIAAGR